MKKGKILVAGSVVLDRIFEEEFFGGTGANIAYGLGKLKVTPLLFSLVGRDFEKDFNSHLKKSGVYLRVYTEKKELTASFSLAINKKGQQIVAWKPNIYKNIHKLSLLETINQNELQKVTIAIFSPGTAKSTLKHIQEFKKYSPTALVIFDPGQEIYSFLKKQLEICINLCDIFIVNDIEYKETKKILKKDPRKSVPGKIIIKTMGEKGSTIFDNNKIIKIEAVRPKRILDITGAGDAYRAGLIFGLYRGVSLAQACTLGAAMASKNVEYVGCQKY